MIELRNQFQQQGPTVFTRLPPSHHRGLALAASNFLTRQLKAGKLFKAEFIHNRSPLTPILVYSLFSLDILATGARSVQRYSFLHHEYKAIIYVNLRLVHCERRHSKCDNETFLHFIKSRNKKKDIRSSGKEKKRFRYNFLCFPSTSYGA